MLVTVEPVSNPAAPSGRRCLNPPAFLMGSSPPQPGAAWLPATLGVELLVDAVGGWPWGGHRQMAEVPLCALARSFPWVLASRSSLADCSLGLCPQHGRLTCPRADPRGFNGVVRYSTTELTTDELTSNLAEQCALLTFNTKSLMERLILFIVCVFKVSFLQFI